MSLKTLDRIIETATAKEIDFLIYIMRFQDNLGVIRGVTRTEVCKSLGVHRSKFYAMLVSLEKKGIIRVYWREKRHGFWTVCVIENSFVCNEDYKKGYINLNTKFLWSKEFLNFTKSEKVICLKVLSLYREQRKNIVLKFKTLMNWTGMTLQSVKKYVLSIKTIFDIDVCNDTITIDTIACYFEFSRSFKSESDIYNEHLLNYILDINKVNERCEDDIKDTLKIFKIFSSKYGINSIITAILKCVEFHGKLIPKYINKMTRIIGNNKNLVELLY